MQLVTTLNLNREQKLQALTIWNTEYPERLMMPAVADFDDFINTLFNPKYYLLLDGEVIAGWAATFFINDIRCFFIMLNSAYHGKGYGTMLLNELKKHGDQLFGWAIDHNNDRRTDGRLYPSPIDFYKKNGFAVNDELRLENEKLSAVNIVWNAEIH